MKSGSNQFGQPSQRKGVFTCRHICNHLMVVDAEEVIRIHDSMSAPLVFEDHFPF